MTGLKIAMIGLRGLPATFGGIERHVEELGSRLADRGHEVVVYCRPGYTDRGTVTHLGMRLVQLPTVQRSGVEAFLHSGLSASATVGRGFDVAHFHALGPGLFAPIPKTLTRAAVVQTIHGLDDQRDKWGGTAQRLLRLGGRMSGRVPHEVVVVSRDLGRHYREVHGRDTTYIPNGVPQPVHADAEVLRGVFGLEPADYVMFLGRLVPEKDPRLLVSAFARVRTDKRLVIVGDSAGTDDYTDELRRLGSRDPRVMFVGYQYGEPLAALLSHAALFVQPSLLEGLPITLLEAAAYGLPVLASEIAPHREVIQCSAPGRQLFRTGDEVALVDQLQQALDNPVGLAQGARELTRDVTAHYDWDQATDALVEVYERGVRLRRG